MKYRIKQLDDHESFQVIRRLEDITGDLSDECLEGMTVWDVLQEYAPEISLREATFKILGSTLPRHQWLIKSLKFIREKEPMFSFEELDNMSKNILVQQDFKNR